DPGGHRGRSEGKIPGAHLFVGVKTPRGAVIPAAVTGTDAGGFDHHVNVPADMDVQAFAYSAMFALTDEQGKGGDKKQGWVRTVRIGAGAKQKKIVVTVTGMNPAGGN